MSTVPYWMAHLCRCGHTEAAHHGACGGIVVGAHNPDVPCRCQQFRHRPIAEVAEAVARRRKVAA